MNQRASKVVETEETPQDSSRARLVMDMAKQLAPSPGTGGKPRTSQLVSRPKPHRHQSEPNSRSWQPRPLGQPWANTRRLPRESSSYSNESSTEIVESLHGESTSKYKSDGDTIRTLNFQVFYCLVDSRKETVYLEEPIWNIDDQGITLQGRSPIFDPEAYAKECNAYFIVYKCYIVDHPRSLLEKALKSSRSIFDVVPVRQDVKLLSVEMIEAMKDFFDKIPTFYAKFPEVDVTERMTAPFIWWYHNRGLYDLESLPSQQAKLVNFFTSWITDNYAHLYDDINEQFSRGRVSDASVEYLIRPGDVLVSISDGVPMGCIATKRPYRKEVDPKNHPVIDNAQRKLVDSTCWVVESRSYMYAGDFFFEDHTMVLEFEAETEGGEVDIDSLNIVPFVNASDNIRQQLARRGKTFWRCRDKQFVAYERNSSDRRQAQQGKRFMIDFTTYKELHPNNQFSERLALDAKSKVVVPMYRDEPAAPEIYLFPALIPGFDLRNKQWVSLEVDRIRDVEWNKSAFDNLVADEEMKELILAVVTNKLSTEAGTDIIENKGNGLIMLLHGSPGTGKTLTAESVAEAAKKPLYQVTCGDIGTKPDTVEKYLQSVFYLGKIWDCVVLLDEAEVFLEQRTLQDLERNALVSVFLRAIEYYDGILILTTNRVGTFDEAFKSRIQLALRYEKPEGYQRKQIWRNFMRRLEALSQPNIDFRDVEAHLDELAKFPMNGRQIRNSITTARQLAKYKKDKMGFMHLKRAIMVADKFERYLADVREAEPDESGVKGERKRYSDEYFARADQIR